MPCSRLPGVCILRGDALHAEVVGRQREELVLVEGEPDGDVGDGGPGGDDQGGVVMVAGVE